MKKRNEKMVAVLIGFGEVGRAICGAWFDPHRIYVHDPWKGREVSSTERPVDVLLVAIPWSERFVEIVTHYQKEFEPRAVCILSSVPVGTTSQIKNAVHSPIEGLHKNKFEEYLRRHPRWIGGENKIVEEFFLKAGCQIVSVLRPETTEFLKLRSTTVYGINIELARWTAKICNQLEFDYELVKEYDWQYNRLNMEMGKPEYQRYILEPPEGKIGGHCVLPNAQILIDQRLSNTLINYMVAINKGFEDGKEKKMAGEKVGLCRRCGKPLTLSDADLCNNCRELETRIERDPALATKILYELIKEGRIKGY